MARRTASKKAQKGAATVEVESVALTTTEEKVLRMRKGIVAPDDMLLERVGSGHPDTLAKLREMELRAFEKSGRIEALRRELGVAKVDSAKEKIISKLKRN